MSPPRPSTEIAIGSWDEIGGLDQRFELIEAGRRTDKARQHPAVVRGPVFDESCEGLVHRQLRRWKETGVVDDAVEKGFCAGVH